MATTVYFGMPYPDPGQGEGWQEMFAQTMEAIDANLWNVCSSVEEAIGVKGVADSELTPYTMMGVGKMFPGTQPLFGKFTISSVVDEWFVALTEFMNGRLALPLRLPELAYCSPKPAVAGATVAGVMGPVVRLKNDSTRTAVVNAPVYLSNDGGMIPAEPFSTQYPVILPTVSEAFQSGLRGLSNRTQTHYFTNRTNQDLAEPDSSGSQDFTENDKAAGAFRTYRGAYFNHANFAAGRALVIRGLARGTFRLYGILGTGVLTTEDILFEGDGRTEEHSTAQSDWSSIVGVSFRGIDLTENVATAVAKDCVCEVSLMSDGQIGVIADLRAFRFAESATNVAGDLGDYETYGEYVPGATTLDYDIFTKPDPRFRASWECYDMGWLWDTSHQVAGVPFLMFGIGMRDNTVAFLSDLVGDLATGLEMTVDDALAFVNQTMTTGLLPIPANPKPMYVVGYNKTGVSKVWTVTPKLVFTTVNNLGHDAAWFVGGVGAATGETLFSGGETLIPSPDVPGAPAIAGTVLVYRYEFPTDLGVLTQILWANSDPILQYSKMFGLAVALPIGRVLAATPAGQPAPVKLWTTNLVDNAAKFNVLTDWLIGYGTGLTTGQRLPQQLAYLVKTFGLSETESRQLLNLWPIITAVAGIVAASGDDSSADWASELATIGGIAGVGYLVWLLNPSAAALVVGIAAIVALSIAGISSTDYLTSLLASIGLSGSSNPLDSLLAQLKTLLGIGTTPSSDTHIETDADGNVTMKFNTAGTAKVVWNATNSRFDFYIGDTIQGILDVTGWSTEPGV